MAKSAEVMAEIQGLFVSRGSSQYGGEAVSQLEHALQAAWLAEQEQAPCSLIAAALLHDVGHLLHILDDDAPTRGIDDRHEDLAASWLEKHFEECVVAPVRLHVAAKRYLCTTDEAYLRTLSGPSLTSLQLQGGFMSQHELAKFRHTPYADEALRLRHWDDAAKIPGLKTPSLDHFLEYVQACLPTIA